MGFLGLFSGAKTALQTAATGAKIVEKATDGIVDGLDKLVYTDEEKAEARQKAAETILKFWQTFQAENTEQSKARRALAKMFSWMFAVVLAVGIGLVLFGDVAKLRQMIEFLDALGFGWIIGCVVATYFVPHQVSKIWKSKNV